MFDFFKKNNSKGEQFYFGLVLKETEGIALILQRKVDNTVSQVDMTTFNYSNAWEHIVEDIDQVLFDLEKNNSIKAKEVIFFLHSNLVDQQTTQVKKAYAAKIKDIVGELDLKGLGFIEFHEAISLYLKMHEEAPLTSIVIELSTSTLSLFIYRGGELFFSDSISKTQNLVGDLQSIFDKVKDNVILPSRIIIYDTINLSKEAEEIMAHKWDESLFIQMPKVEVLSQEKQIDALTHTFWKQYFDTPQVSKPTQQVLVPASPGSNKLGFVIGADIKETESFQEGKKETHKEIEEEPVIKDKPLDRQFRGVSPFQSFLTSVNSIVSKISMKNKPVAFGFLASALLMSFLAGYLYFFHKATFTLYYQSQKEEKEIELKGVHVSQEKKIIESSSSLKTSGEKNIGEKATGPVTIYNKDTADRTFKKGAIFKDSKGIKFILTADVKVASASESLTGEGNVLTVTGKTKATLDADAIGKSGNIAKGEKLTIEGFSPNLYFALVETSFSGGSERKVQTVATGDLTELKENLEKKMKAEESKLLKDADKKVKIVKPLTEVTITDEDYSKEVGEEAKDVSLKGKGEIKFYTYDEDDLKKQIIATLEESIADDYHITQDSISYTIADADVSGNLATLTLEVVGQRIKKTNEADVKKLLKGARANSLESLVKTKMQADGYEVTFVNTIPIFRGFMPLFSSNINLKVKAIEE